MAEILDDLPDLGAEDIAEALRYAAAASASENCRCASRHEVAARPERLARGCEPLGTAGHDVTVDNDTSHVGITRHTSCNGMLPPPFHGNVTASRVGNNY